MLHRTILSALLVAALPAQAEVFTYRGTSDVSRVSACADAKAEAQHYARLGGFTIEAFEPCQCEKIRITETWVCTVDAYQVDKKK